MTRQLQFPIFSRIPHWTMAVLVLAMLFIGIGAVSSLSLAGLDPLATGRPERLRCRERPPMRRRGKRAPRNPTTGTSDATRYNARKKFNRACWSAGDSISKLKITLLASEPALA
jgi:hypothetical protein